ncbi:MAG: hypothetical protein ACE5OZ_18185 [Candidatus Heimdallarchaeota archaeon]
MTNWPVCKFAPIAEVMRLLVRVPVAKLEPTASFKEGQWGGHSKAVATLDPEAS